MSVHTQASQFSLEEVEVITAVVDLNDIRSFRQSMASFQDQSGRSTPLPRIDLTHFSLLANSSLLVGGEHVLPAKSVPVSPTLHSPEEECLLGPACWLWDYLRRSGAGGFLLPLSVCSSSCVCVCVDVCVCVCMCVVCSGANTVCCV